MGDWLTPPWEASGREYTARKRQIEAQERRLKGNRAALDAFHRQQAAQLAAGERAYKASHPGGGCFYLIGLLSLGLVVLARAFRRH